MGGLSRNLTLSLICFNLSFPPLLSSRKREEGQYEEKQSQADSLSGLSHAVRRGGGLPHTWKAMWPFCSTLNEQLVSRNMDSQLQEELPPTKWWASWASSSKEELFQGVRRERGSVQHNKHTSCLSFEERIWNWDGFYNFAARFVYIKR